MRAIIPHSNFCQAKAKEFAFLKVPPSKYMCVLIYIKHYYSTINAQHLLCAVSYADFWEYNDKQ